MDFNVDEFIDNLSQEQMNRLVKRIFPAIRTKLSFRSQDGAMGKEVPGFNTLPLEFTSKEGEYTIKHPLGKIPEGVIHIDGESITVVKKTATDITIQSATADVKNKVLLY